MLRSVQIALFYRGACEAKRTVSEPGEVKKTGVRGVDRCKGLEYNYFQLRIITDCKFIRDKASLGLNTFKVIEKYHYGGMMVIRAARAH